MILFLLGVPLGFAYFAAHMTVKGLVWLCSR